MRSIPRGWANAHTSSRRYQEFAQGSQHPQKSPESRGRGQPGQPILTAPRLAPPARAPAPAPTSRARHPQEHGAALFTGRGAAHYTRGEIKKARHGSPESLQKPDWLLEQTGFELPRPPSRPSCGAQNYRIKVSAIPETGIRQPCSAKPPGPAVFGRVFQSSQRHD